MDQAVPTWGCVLVLPPTCCPAPLPAPAPAASSTHACRETLPQGSRDTLATSWRIQPRLTSVSLSALHCHSPKSQLGSPLPRGQQPTLGTLPMLLSTSGAPDGEGRRGPGEPCAARPPLTPFTKAWLCSHSEPQLARGSCDVHPGVGLCCSGGNPVGPAVYLHSRRWLRLPQLMRAASPCPCSPPPGLGAQPGSLGAGSSSPLQWPLHCLVTSSEGSSSRTLGVSGRQVGSHCPYWLIAQCSQCDMKGREFMADRHGLQAEVLRT